MKIRKIYNWWSGSSSPQYTLYPSTDVAILAGTGPSPTKGYYAFPGAKQFSNGNELLGLRLGSDHNSSADADILVYRRTAGVLSAPTTIKLDPVGYNLTNVSVGVGANDRAFVFYLRLRAPAGAEIGLNTGPGDLFYKYSDDYYNAADPTTATWSSEQRLTTDYGELNTTSTTSVNLNTIVLGNPLSITIGTGIVGITLGRQMNVASRSDFNKLFKGTVTAYDSGTGLLTMTLDSKAGTTTHTDWDASMTSYIDGPGDMIMLANGDLLHPVWTTTGAASTVRVYKSTTASNGAAWSLQGSVPVNASNPEDEAGLVQLLDGRVLFIIRNNNLATYRQSFSSDNGVTWGAVTSTGIGGAGKPAPAISPDGKVMVLARGSDLKTTMFQNTDSTYTTWTETDMDGRSLFMYGGNFWSTTENKFISYYAVEAENSVASTGPNLMIRKEIVQSTIPVAPPTLYDPEYQSVRDFAQAAGHTLPSGALDTANDAFAAGIRADGNLSQSEGYFVFAHNNSALENFAKRNWHKAWLVGTPQNTPTYGVNGYDFNGSTQYFDTGLTPSQSLKYLLNDAEFFYETSENVDEVKVALGAGGGSFSTITNAIGLEPRTSNTLYYWINNSTAITVANASSIGFYEVKRTGAGATEVLKNNVSLGTSTQASTARTTNTIVVGGMRFSASINYQCTWNCRIFGIGGTKGTWYTRWQTRLTAIGL